MTLIVLLAQINKAIDILGLCAKFDYNIIIVTDLSWHLGVFRNVQVFLKAFYQVGVKLS